MLEALQVVPDFKTLWTERDAAPQHLNHLAAIGRISEREKQDLAHFVDHGWLIMPRAIEGELIERFLSDIRDIYKYPGMFIRTDHRNNQSKLRLTGDQPDSYESFFDLYVNLESSRRVCMHPRIVRFLSLVFDSKPVAFQQLLFQRSNGHQPHQDTAFVAVEDPLLMVATWIALEDVREGSGELAYYDRSHRLPHYFFKDGTKRFNPSLDNAAEYSSRLETECRKGNFAYQRFLAKKGDVFFWTADLVHQSHPRTLPDDTSRKSCVTHYYPETSKPFWFRFHPEHRGFETRGEIGAFASGHYRLPNYGKMIQPSSVIE
jgi:phytanoyl-CoA hydroxylase